MNDHNPTTPLPPPGTIIVSTWGYEQTNVDYAIITRATAKRLFARRISDYRVPNGYLSEKTYIPVVTHPAQFGPEFILKPVPWHDGWLLIGTYPYCNGPNSDGITWSKHQGSFQVWDGMPITATHYH